MRTVPLSLQQKEWLQALLTVFLEENEKLNLSAFRTAEQCWVGNILDSIAAVPILTSLLRVDREFTMKNEAFRMKNRKIIDIGTGGGFPLLPLAILFPEISFTGLDATKKKVDAVQRMVNHLALPNVELLIGRAEELGHDAHYREQYDFALSRAVSTLPTLLEFMSPFVKVGGNVLCWKSIAIEEELHTSLEARMQLYCRLNDRHAYALPDDWGRRQILVFKKIETLPQEFPRRTGVPKKEPL